MERRPYFIVGDLLVNAVAGAATGIAVVRLVPDSWNTPLAMLAGMGVGITVGLVIGFIAMPFFGAFEVMLPAMTSGMLAGMLVGTFAPPHSAAAAWGCLAGIFTLAVVYGLTGWSERHG